MVTNPYTHFLLLIAGSNTKILTDNVACMYYINHQWGWGSMSPSLCVEAMRLWNWCISHVTLFAANLLDVQNSIVNSVADSCTTCSRNVHATAPGWGWDSTLWTMLLFLLGTRTFMPFFCFPLLLRVLLKIKRNRAPVILIAPTWLRQT